MSCLDAKKTIISLVFFLSAFFTVSIFNGCDDSVNADEQVETSQDEPSSSVKKSSSSSAKSSSSSVKKSSSSSAKSSSSNKSSSSSKVRYHDSFKPNDKEYPYAGLPRIVIETEYQKKVEDRETEIPAKLQIWGEKKEESEILDLTIRGRGNISWTKMPKKSYKIEFEKKQSMLDMPKDKDWALIANYADKSLMRNYIAYKLSSSLDAFYSPRSAFVELYLNSEYLGVYLLTEKIKIAKERVNIAKDDYSYIVEVDEKYKEDEQVIFSDVLTEKKPFRIHEPKDASTASLDTIQNRIQNFEKFLKTLDSENEGDLEKWMDIEESVKHYWVQEFANNPDADFSTSVFFVWVKGEPLKMGPVWDFDLAFGNHPKTYLNYFDEWHIRPSYWNSALFKSKMYSDAANQFWISNRDLFAGVLDSIDKCQEKLKKSAENNFKRWDILSDTTSLGYSKPFDSYKDAVKDLKNWIKNRIQWFDGQIKKED